jgi:hypothetical protein
LVFVTLDELGVSLNMGWGQQKEMYEKAVLLGLQRVPPEAALALALKIGTIRKYFNKMQKVRLCTEPLTCLVTGSTRKKRPHTFYFSPTVGGQLRFSREEYCETRDQMVHYTDYYVFCVPRN